MALIVTANAHLVKESGLEENRIIVIKLKETIKATDGTFIGVSYYSHFSTTYNPLYADSRRIQAEYGRFLDGVKNDTINQLCWKWSKRADMIRSRGLDTNAFYGSGARDGDLISMVKSDYVTCKVALDLLTGSPDNAGHQKSLADLRILRQSGALQSAIDRAYACSARMEQALKEGGFLGQRAQGVIRGQMDPDRPYPGRLWSSNNPVPAANTRMLEYDSAGSLRRAPRRTYIKRSSKGGGRRGF